MRMFAVFPMKDVQLIFLLIGFGSGTKFNKSGILCARARDLFDMKVL